MDNSTEENPRKNLPKIKIFQKLKQCVVTIGLDLNPEMRHHPFNAKILITFLALTVTCIGTLLYIFLEANTYLEFAQSIYMCSSSLLVSFSVMVIVLHVSELIGIIDDCECFINTSELKNEQISKPKAICFSVLFHGIFQHHKQSSIKQMDWWKLCAKFYFLPLEK